MSLPNLRSHFYNTLLTISHKLHSLPLYASPTMISRKTFKLLNFLLLGRLVLESVHKFWSQHLDLLVSSVLDV